MTRFMHPRVKELPRCCGPLLVLRRADGEVIEPAMASEHGEPPPFGLRAATAAPGRRIKHNAANGCLLVRPSHQAPQVPFGHAPPKWLKWLSIAS
jgi:hypothetical protein